MAIRSVAEANCRLQSPGSIGLYLHVPFCAAKCRYCNFYSVQYNPEVAAAYLDAIKREIELCRDRRIIGDRIEVGTVFFGGGTPSVLSVAELSSLCRMIRESFALASDCEWTVECNPESFTEEKSAMLLSEGVTRLSFGVQSLSDRELRLLGRIHTAERCRLLREESLSSFSSIGVDLMYGLPGQSFEDLRKTLQELLTFPNIQHLSAYELTVAEGTPFGRHRRLLPLPEDSEMSRMTEGLWQLLRNAGFDHYEVSNFARQGHRCRHNEAYWDHRPYLGLGCASHSYLNGQRFANVPDLQKYRDLVENGHLPRAFIEDIDPTMIASEMVLLGLRRAKGIDTLAFIDKCGISFDKLANREKIVEFIGQGLLTYAGPFLQPTERGLLVADALAAALI